MTKQRKQRKQADPRKDAEYRAVHRMDAAWLAEQMAATATIMWVTAERMEYFAGFDPKLLKHGRQLAVTSTILKEWAGFVREQAMKGGGK